MLKTRMLRTRKISRPQMASELTMTLKLEEILGLGSKGGDEEHQIADCYGNLQRF